MKITPKQITIREISAGFKAERNCRLFDLTKKGFVIHRDKRKQTRSKDKIDTKRLGESEKA